MKRSLLLTTLSIWFWALGSTANAAPCCSGSSAIPAMITGDDRAQIAFTLSRATVIGDAPVEGLPVFRAANDAETSRSFRLDGALLLSDRMQAGAGIALVDRRVSRAASANSATRIGDTDLDVAYEVLPEWSYSSWKPRGHVFVGATLPTGRSIYQSVDGGWVDASGKGFYRLQTGGILTKRFAQWDANFVAEFHRSLPRSFEANAANPDPIRVDAGYGGSVAFGAGYSPGGGNLRIGLRIQPSWNSGKSVVMNGSRTNSSRAQTVDTSLEANYLANEGPQGTWTVFGSYVDQTLLGPARNATLSRTFALGVQHRWDR